MLGFLWKTKAELVEDEIASIEARCEEEIARREDAETRLAEAERSRRALQIQRDGIRNHLAVIAGAVAVFVIVSAVWDKTIFIARLSLTTFAYLALGAFAAGWILMQIFWPSTKE